MKAFDIDINTALTQIKFVQFIYVTLDQHSTSLYIIRVVY